MSRLRTLLLSGPAPPDAAAVWFGDLPMDAPLECCYGPPICGVNPEIGLTALH
jgi:hypothetical protein